MAGQLCTVRLSADLQTWCKFAWKQGHTSIQSATMAALRCMFRQMQFGGVERWHGSGSGGGRGGEEFRRGDALASCGS